MGYNPLFVYHVNGEQVRYGGSSNLGVSHTLNLWASTIPTQNDNFNQGCTRYMGLLNTHNPIGMQERNGSDDGCCVYNLSSWDSSWSSRGQRQPFAWGQHSAVNVAEMVGFGYISSYLGSYLPSSQVAVHSWGTQLVSPGAMDADIISTYGHGASPNALAVNWDNQFRLASSLPEDGGCLISTGGTVYSGSKNIPGAWYEIRITNTGTAGSGKVKFYMATRPTVTDFDLGGAWGDPADHPEAYLAGGWWNNQIPYRVGSYMFGNMSGMWTYSPTEGPISPRNNLPAPFDVYTTQGKLLWDPRSGQAASFPIKDEYFGMVFGSFFFLFSKKNRTNAPLAYKDMAALFSRDQKRIADVAVIGSKVYIMSEGGDMILLDYTSVSGGAVTALTAAPVLPTGRRYVGLETAKEGADTVLWALEGHYALGSWEVTKGDPGASLVKFNPTTQVWSAAVPCPSSDIRVGSRSFRGIINSGGSLVFTGDTVYGGKTDIPATTGYIEPRGPWTWNYNPVRTMFIKVPGRQLTKEGVTNPRCRLSWNSPATSGSVKVSLAWVPAESPKGTAWAGSTPITFGGQVQTPINVAGPVQSDPIPVTLTRDNDYYLMIVTPAGISGWSCGTRTGHAGISLEGDLSTTKAVPVGNYDWGWMIFDGFVFDSPDTHQQQTSQASIPSRKFQVVSYNLTAGTWDVKNTNVPQTHWQYFGFPQGNFQDCTQIDSYMWDNASLYPIKGGVLVQATRGHMFFTYDLTSMTINRFLIPWGEDTEVATRATQVLVNKVGDVLIHVTPKNDAEAGRPYWDYINGSAWSPWVWEGGDLTKPAFRVPYQKDWGDGATGVWAPSLRDNVLTVDRFDLFLDWEGHVLYHWMHRHPYQGSQRPPRGLEMAPSNFFMPQFHYWDGGAKTTCSKALAESKPFTVPDHNTSISTVDGIVLKFGPESGNTFKAGEYHSLNVCWGRVKYTRKARYSASIFPGRTFTTSEVKPMDTQKVLSMTKILPYTQALTTTQGTSVTATRETDGRASWAKRNSGGTTWTVDINGGVWPVLTMTFQDKINFSDITVAAWMSRGITWEVSPDGLTFTPITPLWRSHQGFAWVFNRQEGVKAVRMTVRVPQNLDKDKFTIGGCAFYDYGTQAQIDAARLGSSSAPEGTAERGSWDSGCLGVSPAIYVSIDGGTVFQNNPIPNNFVVSWYTEGDVPVNRYKHHPFYGFLRFEGPSTAGSAKSGTNVAIYYSWGKRIL